MLRYSMRFLRTLQVQSNFQKPCIDAHKSAEINNYNKEKMNVWIDFWHYSVSSWTGPGD